MELKLAPGLAPVNARLGDLQRLVELLLQASAGAVGGGPGTITFRTEATNGHVRLSVEDTGPPVPEDQLTRLFEPFAIVREGNDGWRLAVCKTVARRLQARIQGENRNDGGMSFVVELRVASPDAGS